MDCCDDSYAVSLNTDFARSQTRATFLLNELDAMAARLPFRAAPALTRLLRYLVQRAVAEPAGRVTQYDIAVEAMGKSGSYDFGDESYARVTMSRLRKSLAQYYAAFPPATGQCLYVPKGSYAIAVAPLVEAYPELVRAHISSPDTAAEPLSTSILPLAAPLPQARRRRVTLLGAALAVAILASAIFMLWPQRATQPVLAESPTVRVVSDTTGGGERAAAVRSIAEMATSLATSSPVSRTTSADNSDYQLMISAAPSDDGDQVITVTLIDHLFNVLSSAEYSHDPADQTTLEPIRVDLVDLFRPSGLLADALMGKIDADRPRSAFECYLAVDNNRTLLTDEAIVQDCVERFGSDRINLPHVMARHAFSMYLIQAAKGEDIRSSGPAWHQTQLALSMGPYSPYADGLVARVDLAEGRCRRGLYSMARMRKRMEVFPSLRAMMLTEGIACMDEAQRASARQEIHMLATYNVDAAPVLRLYLVLGSIEASDFATAHTLLSGHRKDVQVGPNLEALYSELETAVVDRKPVNHAVLAKTIRIFVWNEEARARIVRNIAAAPSAPSA